MLCVHWQGNEGGLDQNADSSRKDLSKEVAPAEWSWSLGAQRILLLVLAIGNLREAWLTFSCHPILSLLSAAMTAAIAVTLSLTWPGKRR